MATAISHFNDCDSASRALQALRDAGFPAEEVSVICGTQNQSTLSQGVHGYTILCPDSGENGVQDITISVVVPEGREAETERLMMNYAEQAADAATSVVAAPI